MHSRVDRPRWGVRHLFRNITAMMCAVVLLAACSSSSDTNGENGGASPDGPGTSVATDPGGVKSITFSAYTWLEPGRNEGIWNVVSGFMDENPDVVIGQRGIPFSRYEEIILQELAAGTGPDLMWLRANQFSAAAEAGFLANLDDLIDESNFGDSLVVENEIGMVDGSRYGYVSEITNFGLMYNSEILAAAGIDPPTTFEELLSASRELTDVSAGQYGFAVRHTMDESSGWFTDLSYFLYGYDGRWTDENGYPTFDTPEMHEAMSAWMEIYDADVMPVGTDASTFRRMYSEGNIAMMLQNQNIHAQVIGLNPEMATRTLAVPPPFPSGAVPTIPAFLAVNPNSPYVEEAAALIEFLLQPDQQQALAAAYLGGSPATDVYDSPSPELQALLDSAPYLGEVERAVAGGAGVSAVPVGAGHVAIEYGSIFVSELDQVQAGQKTLEEALASAQERAMAVAEADPIISARG